MNDNLLSSVETYRLDEKMLLIHPQNGRWILLEEEEASLIKKLEAEPSLKELKLIQKLKKSGLLEEHSSCNHPCIKKPVVAVLNLTEQCNLECEYCYVCSDELKKKHMTKESARKIADEMVELSEETGLSPMLILHGGEPFLNWNVMEDIVLYAESLPVQVLFSAQTNATLLTPEKVRFCKEHQIQVGVSIDGPAYLHDCVRYQKGKKPSHYKTVRGISYLKDEEMDVSSISVISSKNYADTTAIIEHLIDLGIHSFSFSQIFPTGRINEHEDLFLTGEQLFLAYKNTLDYILQYNLKNPDKKITERTLRYLAQSIFLHEQNYMCMRMPCGAGMQTIGFSTEGEVYACDNLIGNENYYIGNIYEHSLSDLLRENQVIQKLCSRTMENQVFCKDCMWRAICGGLCISQTDTMSLQDIKKHPVCEFRKLMIPYMIKLQETYPQLLDLITVTNGTPIRDLYSFVLYDENASEPMIDVQIFSCLVALYDVKDVDFIYLYRLECLPQEEIKGILQETQKINGTVVVCIQEDFVMESSYAEMLLQSDVLISTSNEEKNNLLVQHRYCFSPEYLGGWEE